MYFKKLEIVGFKSFLNKTVLHFEPGVTAVVGPNGCGKSNIFDSIRWVLGEQSVKSLRGSDMQDVIFNGTDIKEPLSMAEVSLTFDNDQKYFSIDHDEVTITRRIFRSGESEYLLNKTQVRLKDILDLLMGTGIGAESYSLVEQGKIDLVLSSRPEDRRLVFDEAAGITKYKVQKREAMRKLEETQQNLLRVNDIITEVKRQIGSLERQANKARRYKEAFEELKQKEISLALWDKNQLALEKDNIINQLKELQVAEDRLLSIIQGHESKNSDQRGELKAMEEAIMAIKNQIMTLENSILANKERVNFNQEKIKELDVSQKHLEGQIEQTKKRLSLDEEKLNNLKNERNAINQTIEEKRLFLQDKEGRLSNITLSTKNSLEAIAKTNRSILGLVTKFTQVKNEIADLTGKQHIYSARKKRLEIEKIKVNEEKAKIQDNLDNLNQELKELEKDFQDLSSKISDAKDKLQRETQGLNNLNTDISNLEREKSGLLSHKEFLDKLKTKYEDISESMNAQIYLDRQPSDKITALVIKIKDPSGSTLDGRLIEGAKFKLYGEAKPIDLDAQKINQKLSILEDSLRAMEGAKTASQARIAELNQAIFHLQEALRNQEITLANKKASHQAVLEQFNKIRDEEEVIVLELSEVGQDLSSLENTLVGLQTQAAELDKEQKGHEELILKEQNNINANHSLKEQTLVAITQAKTELEGLSKRIDSEGATLKILEDTCQQDKESLLNFEEQVKENADKQQQLALEIKNSEGRIEQAQLDIQEQNNLLKETEDKYRGINEGVSDAVGKVEADRKELDNIKNKLYELQMQNKDVDFKITSLKERILQSYKADLDMPCNSLQEAIDKDTLSQEIEKLKDRLDSYGTVNLVAIEEYDELKKRYDFLTQQQNDLVTARESVHEAILKINRTTKKMFLETFEKVRLEFKNYFRLLFNGGDAQVFLVDEQDPLESGIEIICRPPGKKLQNVLLLSGGEKSMSAIALIFAIFKVKPSPFCVLDEIDAALDEANVDRFGRMLQEFIRTSQFIVITHNKKTIANADVMYGITMEESGVSKIVSVKFGGSKAVKDKEADVAVVEPAGA
ncbi:MAG: AAA family ATPase [Candidatus Omnitrophica bacterium]|nr:AAA family ATPase [Candidatus Omnitrophota bacterium]MDD5591829.1 AAA family ATPase [Candidatus Omnitrophota bacterium]